MAKEIAALIKLQVKGGAANPSPPIGPALGAKGVNIMEFCKQFNARTQDKAGKVLPVVITVYADKSFDFIIKTPPAAVQIIEAAKIKGGSGEPHSKKVGSINWEQIRAIAQDKMPDLNCFTIESAMSMVAGTARSMGVTVSGNKPFYLGTPMNTLTKKRKAALSKFDTAKIYSLQEATQIVKQVSTTKFDATVDIAVRLGVDPKKSTEMVRGTVSLPHGTGRTVNVLVLADPAKCEEALAAGADMAGLEDYIEKIKGGWTNVDVIICTPAVMAKVGALGRVLGPRGLMPNPKTGTVTMDVAKAVKEVKAGKIDFKVDKAGIIHAVIGKASFDAAKLSENAHEILLTLVKLKPSTAKGAYIKSISISSTMSPGVQVDTRTVQVA